jgi:ubiquinone/menaquinone biosynthesis C-methylase UbiE
VALLPAEVIAVEPVDGMRAQLERVLPGVTALDGTAEQIPLADGAAHAVFVAQAFHWFRVPEAATEIARVLDADGALAIVRNQEVESDTAPAVAAALALVRERVQNPTLGHRVWRDELEQTRVFEPFQEWTVANDIRQDIDTFRHRIASRSYIGALDDAQRGQLLDDVQTVLEAHGVTAGEPFAVPTVTRVLWARTRRGP